MELRIVGKMVCILKELSWVVRNAIKVTMQCGGWRLQMRLNTTIEAGGYK